jgi:hypothetical protein
VEEKDAVKPSAVPEPAAENIVEAEKVVTIEACKS